jgi:hypothetical protein
MTTFFTKDLCELLICEFAQLCKESFLSQLEINHLIQQQGGLFLADYEGFQQLVSASAADYTGQMQNL